MLIKNIGLNISGKQILNVPKFEIAENKITAILGPNGSGKSCLLKVLSGIEERGSKEVITEKNKHIYFMHQNPYIFDKTAYENVLIGLKDYENAKEIAKQEMQKLNIFEFADRNALTLSGGEAQRVALARTLAKTPDIAFLDEPASAADVSGVLVIEKYLQEKKDMGTTILMTTHNPAQALRIADFAYIMWNGEAIEKNTPEELFCNPKDERTKAFINDWGFSTHNNIR